MSPTGRARAKRSGKRVRPAATISGWSRPLSTATATCCCSRWIRWDRLATPAHQAVSLGNWAETKRVLPGYSGSAMPELPAPRPVAAKPDTLTPKFMAAVIAGVVVSGLYFGRPVLLPLALSVLISFALAPLVSLLKRLNLGNVVPVLISVTLAVVILS